MENLYTILEVIASIALPVSIYLLFVQIFTPNNIASVKFAKNTASNHARIDGVNQSGKITHQKYSCGASTIISSALNNYNEDSRFIVKGKDSKEKITFSLVPQTRLHGAGWYA